jgi:hypothetical protein
MVKRSSRNAARGDPLVLFAQRHRKALDRPGKRFAAGEHAWLASAGAKRAREAMKAEHRIDVEADVFESIARHDGTEFLQYGEIVALSGDFYETPTELFEERSSLIALPGHTNDLGDLRKIFAEELDWIEARRKGKPGATYPDENVRLAWNAKSYVELALRNTDHFGWHNAVAYCKHHARALELARAAQGRTDEKFRRALYTNAFADHFLTDGFAAGHVRVPRAEIRAWALENRYGEKVAGSLSKLLHDQDGHVDVHSLHGDSNESHRGAADGLRVQDAHGDAWFTFCDGQLFMQAAGTPAIEHAVSAVAASVKEFLEAWKLDELPDGVYQATRLVPFPHPEAPKLVDKFPANMADDRFDALWESIAWYAKIPYLAGLEAPHVRALFEALPQIMSRFRENIATASADAELRRRLAPGYVDAYKRIA